MAASLFASSSGGIELSDVISCVWCKRQQLTQLVQLGCFHLACKVCLQRKIEDPSPGTPFNCPECDMLCMVPMEGLDGFPDEPIQHKMHQITMIFSNDKPKCKLCDQVGVASNSSNVCVTCKINLCENDAKRHQGTPGHTVITHQELCVEPNLSLMLKTKAEICQEHASEKNYFCIDCDIQICSDCGMLNHSEHKKDSAKNIAAKYRMNLEGKLEEIKCTKTMATSNMQRMEDMQSEIQEMHKKSVEKIQKETKGDKTENLLKLAKETKGKTNEVKGQITEGLQMIKKCNSAESYLHFFLKFASDSDVIEKFQEFVSNLGICEIADEYVGACALSEKMQAMRLNENDNETTGIEIKELRWELEVKWKIPTLAQGVAVYEGKVLIVYSQKSQQSALDGGDKREFALSLENAEGISVCDNEMYVCAQKNKDQAVYVFDLNWKLKRKLSLPDKGNKKNSCLAIAVDRVGKDIYVASVGVNTVYKFEKRSNCFLPWVTSDFNKSAYLCVAPDQHLLVSTHITVIKYSPKGDVVWRYNSISFWAAHSGVCADLWGNVFIADWWNNRIVVVSDGKWLMNVDIGEKIKNPAAIAFGNNRLIVATDTISSGKIYVIKRKS